jgi:hypothetical protein
MDNTLDWIEISLFALSIVLLIVVYFIRSQLQLIKFHKNYCTKTNSYYSLSLTIPLAPSSLKIKRRILD